MSAVFDDFGDPDRSARSSRIAVLAHRVLPVVVVTLILRMIYLFVDLPWQVMVPVEVNFGGWPSSLVSQLPPASVGL